MPKLSSALKSAGATIKRPKPAVIWQGPCDESPQGGVTQGLLSKFLACRERFRLRTMEGIDVADSFRKAIEYGQMWHTCEEAHAAGVDWKSPLTKYCQDLCKKYRTQQSEVLKWYQVCQVQFPIYVQYWSKHPEVKDRTPLLQEQTFNVPYLLPSGRIARLRGKWDSVDLIGKGKAAGVYLQENKTKGDIVEPQLKKQLSFDLQTMTYTVALQKHISDNGPLSKAADGVPIKGVRYNVIRRPLSGGKGSIKQLEAKGNRPAETDEEYYSRLQQYFIDEPEYWFMRWKVEVSSQDIERFKREFLEPTLEAMCDWYEFITLHEDPFDPAGHGIHWRTPYGIYNPLAEGRSSDVDEFLASGSDVGLERGRPLFRELEE